MFLTYRNSSTGLSAACKSLLIVMLSVKVRPASKQKRVSGYVFYLPHVTICTVLCIYEIIACDGTKINDLSVLENTLRRLVSIHNHPKTLHILLKIAKGEFFNAPV